jgi:hypothetical protein
MPRRTEPAPVDPPGAGQLPPDPLPPLPEPHSGEPGPYSRSPLRDVCGSRINPDAIGWYRRRELMKSPECGVKTCAHPDLEQWLGNVGSFDPRMMIKQPPASEWPLSAVIAQIQVWGNKLPYPLPENLTCLVNYEDLAPNPHTPPTDERIINLRERFDPSHKLILGFFGEHRYKLGLWTMETFWHEPFLDNFDAVLMPDFSAFSDDPIPQSLLGERMLQIFAEEGYQAGRTVIPTIAWRSEDSLRRQVELVASLYPRVNTVMLDCYGGHVERVKWAWRWLFAIEKYCADLPIRWLIAGMSAGWAVVELREMFPRGNFHIITPAAMHRVAMSAVAKPEIAAARFYQKIRAIEEVRSGERTPTRMPRPDEWPTFSQAKLPSAQI